MSWAADYRHIRSELFARAVGRDARLLVLALSEAGLDGHCQIGERFGVGLHDHLAMSERSVRRLVRQSIDDRLLSDLTTTECLVLPWPEVQSGQVGRPRCQARHAGQTSTLRARSGKLAALKAELLAGLPERARAS